MFDMNRIVPTALGIAGGGSVATDGIANGRVLRIVVLERWKGVFSEVSPHHIRGFLMERNGSYLDVSFGIVGRM